MSERAPKKGARPKKCAECGGEMLYAEAFGRLARREGDSYLCDAYSEPRAAEPSAPESEIEPMSERAQALEAREWQIAAYGDSPETWAALAFYRERGWPVDANTFPERERVEDRISAFKAGYRTALEAPAVGVSREGQIPGYNITYAEMDRACEFLRDHGWAGGLRFDAAVAAIVPAVGGPQPECQRCRMNPAAICVGCAEFSEPADSIPAESQNPSLCEHGPVEPTPPEREGVWNPNGEGQQPDIPGGIAKDHARAKQPVIAYACLYPKLAAVAREHGYALAMHGSLVADCDLIAVPWILDAKPHAALVRALAEVAGGLLLWDTQGPRPAGVRKHIIHLGGGPYIDLAVFDPSLASVSPVEPTPLSERHLPPAVVMLVSAASAASGYLERLQPDLAARLWAGVQAVISTPDKTVEPKPLTGAELLDRFRQVEPAPPTPAPCVWTVDGWGHWHTTCGRMWTFADEGYTESRVVFCPGCGAPAVFPDQITR